MKQAILLTILSLCVCSCQKEKIDSIEGIYSGNFIGSYSYGNDYYELNQVGRIKIINDKDTYKVCIISSDSEQCNHSETILLLTNDTVSFNFYTQLGEGKVYDGTWNSFERTILGKYTNLTIHQLPPNYSNSDTIVEVKGNFQLLKEQ